MAPWQLYDGSNLPYVEIISDKQGEGVARERAELFDCQYRHITKKQAEKLQRKYARISRTLGHSASMPAIED